MTRDVSRNVGLLAVQPSETAASSMKFYWKTYLIYFQINSSLEFQKSSNESSINSHFEEQKVSIPKSKWLMFF